MMSPPKARLVVLISGNGSNLQAMIDAIQSGIIKAEISAVISNKRDAYGLERARKAGIPVLVLPKMKEQTREEYDAQLAQAIQHYAPDWVILAGWMRILSMNFLRHFPNRVINLHPALPGTFPGTHAIERAYEAFQRGEIQETGVMVHLVPDEGVDAGPVLAQAQVAILPGDTLADLETRIHQTEHRLLVDTLVQIISKEE
jgi:phosphoribosylglycinamide formyltransferase-1